MAGGRFYGKQRFNPRRHCCQMWALQLLFWVALTTAAFTGSSLVGEAWTPFAVFDVAATSAFAASGWITILSLFFAGLALAIAVSFIVGRLRHSVDFVFTVFVVHLAACILVAGFPVSGSWWVACVASFLLSSSLGEYLCLKREMQEIALAPPKRRTPGGAPGGSLSRGGVATELAPRGADAAAVDTPSRGRAGAGVDALHSQVRSDLIAAAAGHAAAARRRSVTELLSELQTTAPGAGATVPSLRVGNAEVLLPRARPAPSPGRYDGAGADFSGGLRGIFGHHAAGLGASRLVQPPASVPVAVAYDTSQQQLPTGRMPNAGTAASDRPGAKMAVTPFTPFKAPGRAAASFLQADGMLHGVVPAAAEAHPTSSAPGSHTAAAAHLHTVALPGHVTGGHRAPG